jgi:hypothetical protein
MARKMHTAILMVGISAGFPNTSKEQVGETLRSANPDIAQ